jgi:hypothetical protein
MKKIFVCSPFAGDIERNTLYAQEACRFVVGTGNNPFAPHLFYPQFIDERTGRQAGIKRGIQMLVDCDEVWVFTELGRSAGMNQEIDIAGALPKPVRCMQLGMDTIAKIDAILDERVDALDLPEIDLNTYDGSFSSFVCWSP